MGIKSIAGGYLLDMRPEGRKGRRIRKKFKTKSDAVLYERWVLARNTITTGRERPPIAVHCLR